MGKFGLKIKNYEAGILYEYNLGVRNHLDYTNAMLAKSLFYDFLIQNGMETHNGASTKDIICIQFGFGSSSFEDQKKKIKKAYKNTKTIDDEVARVEKLAKLDRISEEIELNKDKFDKKSAYELRKLFYTQGVDVHYKTTTRNGNVKHVETIHYKMLYRTPGKAKQGSCMFIREELYEKAADFLSMGIQLPEENAPIVEIAAYSSLITSSIVDRIKIKPENILILKDVDSFFETNVVSIETDEHKHCFARDIEGYKLKNTLFDGQALIDSSIFPSWGEGYILLRHHFFKAAAFVSHLQQFFKDYFGDSYNTATVKDMFGNEHLAKDIQMITTDNACKWLKFSIPYEYWSEWVHKNGCQFGIVKTAHRSKLGFMQRMSYQMVNALNMDTMDNVVEESLRYISLLKTDDEVFFDYLRRNVTFSNDFDVLLALCEQDPLFVRSEYFVSRRNNIINAYVMKFKNGKVIQNADNLVIVGSPYAMLLHSVGEDVNKDPTFTQEEDAIQCYTERFNWGEYLAEFRSPFNSRNNLGLLHNVTHPLLEKYFPFGEQIIAVNMIGTFMQDRNNGQDQDSDSIYVTNQRDIVEHARGCMLDYPTIVNNVPKEKNHYSNTMEDKAEVDYKIAAANMAIGESSNLAQLGQTYWLSYGDRKYYEYVCILSILAQLGRFQSNLIQKLLDEFLES